MPVAPSILAPGRVNLIGEHTDYSGGLVLPVAVDRGVTVRWRPDAHAIRLRSAAFPETVVELAPDGTPPHGLTGWGRYAAAVAALLTERGRPAVGLDGWVTSTVPIGAGLSSSAALTVAVGLALCRAAGFELSQLQLAHVCREAEYRAVGVPVGLMDPAVCLLARRGHALLLDCATDEHRLIPLPESLAIVVLDSGVRHQLEHSGYATRRAELERALPALERGTPLAGHGGGGGSRSAGGERRRDRAPPAAPRRLRERARAGMRAHARVAGRPDRRALGSLFRDAHASLRDDFEVSTPEIDLLVELAYDHGALAARMTGGGFGGSVVALADAGEAEAFTAEVTEAYVARTGRDGTGYVCETADAAG